MQDTEFTFTGTGILKRVDRFTTKAGKEILTPVAATEGNSGRPSQQRRLDSVLSSDG